MPVQHFIDPAMRLVITKCWGTVSRDEVVASLQELKRNPDFSADFQQLIDLSEVSGLKLGFNDMEIIHRLYDPFSNEGRRAVIAPGQGAIYGLSRMYQLLVDHDHFAIVHNLDSAIVWLGLQAAKAKAAVQKAASQASPPDARSRASGSTEFNNS